MLVCTVCGRENPDDARFCSSCGSAFEATRSPAAEVRKVVTVVFCDVTDSTELGERLDPESLRRVMERYFASVQAVLLRHGGSIEKFIGDAVVAVFGIPVLHEDDALRAVRAAAEMRALLGDLNADLDRTWGVSLAVRTGVNTGEVVVARADGGESNVLGDAINVAARLEQAAEPGEILIGEDTYLLVRDAVRTDDPAELEVKGKSGTVRARRLVEVSPDALGSARRLDSPIVGRDHEQTILAEAYGRAVRERSSHLFTVLGAAGVGKSRLIQEFVERMRGEARVLTGRCLPYGEGITYLPLVQVLRQALGVRDDEPEAAASGLRDAVAGRDGSDEVARVLGGVLGASEATSESSEIAWATRRLLEHLARATPVVLVLDDVHWAEGLLLDLVEHLADWTRDAPILLVCLARPELLDTRPMWGGGKMNATSVLLEPLNADESARLLDNLLGGELDERLKARVTSAAEGNPLFVEEMVEMLVDDGVLVRRNGGWHLDADPTELAVPPTIHALLAARLDRLIDVERTVLERASIEGKSFHRGAVEALVDDRDRPGAGQSLQALVRKELIRPDQATFAADDAFRFRHIFLRDAAYRGIPKEMRSELHERHAGWLEGKAHRLQSELDAILGYHLEQAFRYREELGLLDADATALARRAAERLAVAGRRSLRQGDVRAGANLLGRAVELLRAAGSPAGDVVLDLAEALRATGDLSRARDLLGEAREEAARAGDRRLEAHAQIDELILESLIDPDFRTSELLEASQSALALLQEAGDDLGLSKAWRGIAEVHLTSCHWAECAVALERALVHGRRAGDEREVALALPFLANALYWGPTPVRDGIPRCEEILAQAGTHLSVAANALTFLGGFEAMRGEFDRARELFARARAIFEELGHTYGLLTVSLVSGPSLLLAGDAEAAAADLAATCAALEAMGELGTLASAAAFHAEALLALGRLDEARAWTETSERTAAADDVAARIALLSVRARLVARAGDRAAAEALGREAAELAAATDFVNMQADVQLALAEVTGEDAPVRRALELYDRKGNDSAARRARALMSPTP